MPCCTFFGHREIDCDIDIALYATLTKLVEEHNVNCFYVGHQGAFDALVCHQLKKLQLNFPHVSFTVVLAYLPKEKSIDTYEQTETLYPSGLENTPPKYAINKRNQWMIDHSDFAITYVKYPFGGAAKWEEIAIKKGLSVFPLVDKIK